MARRFGVLGVAVALLPVHVVIAAPAKPPMIKLAPPPAPPPPPIIVAPPAPPVPKQVERGPIPQPVPAPSGPVDPKADKERRKAIFADLPICRNAGELKDWMVQTKFDACNRLLAQPFDPSQTWLRRDELLQHRALALLNLPGGQRDALATLDAGDALAAERPDQLWDNSGRIGNLILRAYALNGLGERDKALKVLDEIRAARPWSMSVVASADALEGTFTNDLAVLARRMEQRQRIDPDVTRFLVFLYLMQGEHAKSSAAAERLSLVDPRLGGGWSLRGEGDAKDQLADRLRYDCIKAYVASALGDEDKARQHFATARQAVVDYVGPDLTLITDQTRKPSRSQLKAYEQRKVDAADLGDMVDEWTRLTAQRRTTVEAQLPDLIRQLGQFKHKGDLVPGVVEQLDHFGKTHGGTDGADARLLAAELLRRVLGDVVRLEPRALGVRLPRIETLDQIPKFASSASKWLFSDGSGYSQSKEGDGEVRTVRYETLVGSRSLVEEMGLLAIANYARQEGKNAFVILSDRTIARTTTISGYYGGGTTTDSGFEAQFRVRLVDSEALPADLAAQRDRVITVAEVEQSLRPRYDAYQARKDAEAAARKAAKEGGKKGG